MTSHGQSLATIRDHQLRAPSSRLLLVALLTLLLLTAALRVRHLIDFVEWPDEIVSVWQARLNVLNGFSHVDPFWPPLFDLLHWGWGYITGQSVETHRFLSVLIALLAVSLVYRAALSLSRFAQRGADHQQRAALISSLAFATMGYSVFAGVDVRGYGLLLMLLPLALWLTVRWLCRPTWRTAAYVAVSLALLLHAGYSSLIFIPFLTLFVVATRPRLFLQWVGIGIGVLVLVVPIIPKFVENNVLSRLDALHAPLPPISVALADIYRDFGGSNWIFVPLAAAAVLIVVQAIKFRSERRPAAFLAAWVLLFPIFVYFSVNDQNFWVPRYLWWVTTGLALFVGFGLARLPRAATWIAAAVFVLLPAVPTNFFAYRLAETTSPPFRLVLSWFAQNVRPGDVLIIDPHCTCGKPMGWDLFVPQYFPTGYLPIVLKPGSASRVWYLSTSGWPRDEALLADIQTGRKPSIFVGPWYFLLRLYEGPPSWTGIGFGGKIRFNGIDMKASNLIGEDETLQVKLWWSAQEALTRDYSMSLALLDSAGTLIAQADGPARSEGTPGQTSQWQVGTYYEDVRQIHVPASIVPGTYRLVLAVYQWWDGARLVPESNALWQLTGTDQTYLQLAPLQVPATW